MAEGWCQVLQWHALAQHILSNNSICKNSCFRFRSCCIKLVWALASISLATFWWIHAWLPIIFLASFCICWFFSATFLWCFRSGCNSFWSLIMCCSMYCFCRLDLVAPWGSNFVIPIWTDWCLNAHYYLPYRCRAHHHMHLIWKESTFSKSQPCKFPASASCILLSAFFWLLLIRNLGVSPSGCWE